MSIINLDNVNFNNLLPPLKRKLVKSLLAGLVVTSMTPILTGCGGKQQKPSENDYQIRFEYFSEEDKAKEWIQLSSDHTNNSLEELAEFGENIRSVYIDYGYYIDDLSALVEYCPNIEKVDIAYSPSISDLSFLYSLPNLKEVYIKESGYVTPALVEYFDKMGIKHNITKQELENAEELDRIISEIITDDMTDEEKIQAVTYYVITRFDRKLSSTLDSNINPLSSMLEHNRGVCAGYSYVTTILLRKAGIKSYNIKTDDKLVGHNWNLIYLDGKYYYIDTANINQVPFISEFALKYLNIAPYYMTDPRDTAFSSMVDFDKVDKVNIPPEMIADIERGESEKNLIEKYGNSVPASVIKLLMIVVGVMTGLDLAARGACALSDTVSYKRINRRKGKRKATKKSGHHRR